MFRRLRWGLPLHTRLRRPNSNTPTRRKPQCARRYSYQKKISSNWSTWSARPRTNWRTWRTCDISSEPSEPATYPANPANLRRMHWNLANLRCMQRTWRTCDGYPANPADPRTMSKTCAISEASTKLEILRQPSSAPRSSLPLLRLTALPRKLHRGSKRVLTWSVKLG